LGNLTRVTRIKARLAPFTDRDQRNTGLAEYFRSICYPRERVRYATVLFWMCILLMGGFSKWKACKSFFNFWHGSRHFFKI